MPPKEDMVTLSMLTVAQLRQRIQSEMKVTPKGTKNDLILMLMEHYNGTDGSSRSPARSRKTEGTSPSRGRKASASPARGRQSQSPARSASRDTGKAAKPTSTTPAPNPGQVRYNYGSSGTTPPPAAPARRSSAGRKSGAADAEAAPASTGGLRFNPALFVQVFLYLLMATVALVLMYNLAPGFLKPWCNPTLKSKDCRPCPAHAKCTNVTFTCDGGYLRKRDSCIENQEISNAAYHLISNMQSVLGSHAGKFKCKLVKNEGLTSDELLAQLKARGDDAHPQFKEVMDKAKKLIKESSEHDISITKGKDETVRFTSTRPRKPVKCAVSEFAHANRKEIGNSIIGLILSALAVSIVYSSAARAAEVARARKKALRVLYQLRQARDADGTSAAIEAAHLRDTILDDKMALEAKNRAFAKVANALRYDSRVKEAIERRAGADVTVFEWNAATPPRPDEML